MNLFLFGVIGIIIMIFILVYIEHHDRVCDRYIKNNSKNTNEWLSDIAKDITNSKKLK